MYHVDSRFFEWFWWLELDCFQAVLLDTIVYVLVVWVLDLGFDCLFTCLFVGLFGCLVGWLVGWLV